MRNKLYHGSHTNEKFTAHEGICLTSRREVAERYGEYVHEVEIEMDGLEIAEAGGYDHDTNDCPADDNDFRRRMARDGIDVLEYEDEDELGRTHDCVRLISERALAAIK